MRGPRGATMLRECYLCGLPYEGSERWSPDRQLNIERLHCSRRCFRMHRVAYASDRLFRLEYAIKREQELLNTGSGERGRITALRRELKQLKRERRERVRRLASYNKIKQCNIK